MPNPYGDSAFLMVSKVLFCGYVSVKLFADIRFKLVGYNQIEQKNARIALINAIQTSIFLFYFFIFSSVIRDDFGQVLFADGLLVFHRNNRTEAYL